MGRLNRDFFEREAESVAKDLIGKVLVRRLPSGLRISARIVETEAYIGPEDLACHASKGRTPRTEVMFGKAGFIYVYFVYGMHYMLNFVTGPEGFPAAVLIRAAESLDQPDSRLMKGPGRLTKFLQITKDLNTLDVTRISELSVEDVGSHRPRVLATTRIGVDYAGIWARKKLRFLDPDSPAVSKNPS